MDIGLPEGATYVLDLDPLAQAIQPEQSSYVVKPTKVEINLVKATPGSRWGCLEGVDNTPMATLSISSTPTSSTSYPTSSKKKTATDWDSLEVDEKDGGQDEENVDAFFKTLYKDLDPDARRAMVKSYVESGGTVLSTDWSKVGKGEVKPEPGEDMVAKKVSNSSC